MTDYVTPFIEWLLKSDYVQNNKLFLNAINAKDNNLQLVTEQINKKEDKEYVDGSILHIVRFTIFDFKSISFMSLVKSMIDQNENITDLLETSKIISFIESMENIHSYPNFGKNFEVQQIYPVYDSPSTPIVDNNMSPALARYSIPIICEVLENVST